MPAEALTVDQTMVPESGFYRCCQRSPLFPWIALQPKVATLTSFLDALVCAGNPTGAVCPRETMVEIAHLCRENNSWLVVDEAYEHFLHDGER